MKVIFPMRADVFKKSGGDRIQVEKYITLLKDNHGVDAFISNNANFSHMDADIVHLTNIDRPIDTYLAYRRAREQNMRIVLSPIHHSYTEINNYEKFGRAGVMSIFGGLLNFHRLEALRGIFRARSSFSEFIECLGVIKFGLRRAQSEILNGVALSLPLSEWERNAINCDFDLLLNKYKVIPNGIDRIFDGLLGQEFNRDIDCLIVGRIEARKNQISILKALESLGLSGVFVGALNKNHGSYCRNFLSAIKKSNSRYIGVLPQTDIYELYARSKVHISASWFEVMSLVDIEASAFGCTVVASECGSTKELMGDYAYYVDPRSISSIEHAVTSALQANLTCNKEKFDLNQCKSWAEVVDEIYEQYLGLLQ